MSFISTSLPQQNSRNGSAEPTKLPPIQRNDRVFLVGTTGSGKTTLAAKLLSRQSHLIVIDPKHQFSPTRLPIYKLSRGRQSLAVIVTKLNMLSEYQEPVPLIYRPSVEDIENGLEPVFSWVYERGNTIVYIDEILPIVTTRRGSQVYRRELARCIQMGRTKGIGIWVSTQRPAMIPVPIISEAEHDFIFRLRRKEDRQRMADYTIPDVLTKPPHGHGFYYYSDRTQTAHYFDRVRI